MADVFISHSSIDKEVADKVCAALEAKGLTCWIAPRDIVPGSEWAVAISNAIAEIKAMVVIYSKNAGQSTQVPKEIALAEKRGKCILPYKIDEAELTGAFEYYLSGSHWIVASPEKNDYKLDEMYGVLVGIVAAVVALLVVILLVVKSMQGKEENLGEKEKDAVSIEQSKAPEAEDSKEVTEELQENITKLDFEYTVRDGEASVTGYLGTDTHVVIPAYINGIQITSIANNAFQNCENLQTIELPEGLQTIGAWAFAESSLTEIEIPDSVSEIGENAFINCVSLKKVRLPRDLTEIKTRCFFGCSGLTQFNLPQGLQTIGDWALSYTPFVALELTDATITEIGTGAFAGCENLETVRLSSTVKTVNAGAFQYCTKLTTFVLPDDVETVEYGAFLGADQVMITYKGQSYTLGEARYLPIMGHNKE